MQDLIEEHAYRMAAFEKAKGEQQRTYQATTTPIEGNTEGEDGRFEGPNDDHASEVDGARQNVVGNC